MASDTIDDETSMLLSSEKQELIDKYTDAQLTALDDLVSVNSLFTMAIFLGLSIASPNAKSLDIRPECGPTVDEEKRLVVCEVISFACFLLSSLVAKAIKLYLNVHSVRDTTELLGYHVIKPARGLMTLLSVTASMCGVLLLLLSMVDVVQIKIGSMSCEIHETSTSVITVTVIVCVGLLVYIPSAMVTILSMTFVSK